MAPTLWKQWRQFALPADARIVSPQGEMAAKLSLALAVMIPTWLVTLALGIGFVFARKFAPTALILANLCGAVASYRCAHQGRARLGAWVLLASSWIVVTITAWLAGGLGSIIPIYYIVLTAAAAWLLGRSAAVRHAVVSCAALALMAVADAAGAGPPRYFPVPPLAGLLVFGVAMTLFTAPLLHVLESEARARDCLRESERQASARAAQLQATMDAAPAAIFVAHDAECSYISGNRAAYAFFRQQPGGNLSKSAPQGEQPANFRVMQKGAETPAEDLPMQRAARTGQPVRNCELQVVFDDGVSIDLLGNVEPVFDDSGRPRGAVAVMSDITERKQAERVLAASEEKYRALVEATDTGYLILAKDGKVIDANREYVRLTGHSELEEILGRSVIDWTTAEEKQKNAEAVARCLKDGFVRNLVIDYADGNGRVTPVEINAKVVGHGESTRIISLCRDITERKRAEATLRESEERFRTVADTAPVMIWMAGLDKLCTFFNKPWLDFTGRTMEQELGNGWFSGVHPGDQDRCYATYSSSFDARRSFQIEYRLKRASGEYRWVLDSGTPRYREGEFAGYIGSCIDITEAKRAQEESFARQKLESLGALASGIAHDFNNLLGATLAQTELAMAELATGSRPEDELAAIRDVAVRGSEIVRQLMVYAGKESGVPEPADVSKVVREMLGLLKVTVSPHAALVTGLGEDLPAVRARAAQISQIVMNLVVNASEAIGDREGVIRVTTARTTVGRAEAISKALPAGDFVRLEVSDTGRGMSPETQAKVFDPFFTTKFSGRGLGLAVVHGIVRGVHGHIQVRSEIGKGTTFEVLLPCMESGVKPDAGRVIPVEEFTPPAGMAGVLFVEDEEQLRIAVGKMLRRSGLQVFEASTGSAAIELLRAKGGEIDLILLDLTIPGSPSEEVLAEAARSRPDVKVILTSAYSEEVARPMMRAPQVCGFIRKPFKLGDLLRTLRSVLLS